MKPFSNPPEIEELPELTWKRIEGQLFDTLSHQMVSDMAPDNSSEVQSGRSKGLLLALFGTGLVAAAAFVLLYSLSSEPSESSEPVESIAGAETEQASSLQSEKTIVSTRAEALQLDIGAASVEIAANSSVAVAEKGDVVSLSLLSGGLSVNVEKGEVVVQAGVARAIAQNSSFSVHRTELGSDIEVVRGMLTVHRGDKEFVLRANEQWPVPKESAALEPDTAVETVSENVGAPIKSPQKLYEEGQRMEASRPKLAIVAYRKAWAHNGAWAANALFAHARLEAARGNRKQAQRLLQRYLRRFPKGANARDAVELLR